MVKRLLTILLALFITSCGFHLRGVIGMPEWLNDVALLTPGSNNELRPLLRAQLEAYHLRVVEDTSQARYLLVITGSQIHQEIVSIGASTNPRQSHIILTLDYYLQENKGKMIIPDSKIAISRQLTVNNDRILGSDEEANLIFSEMRQDAVVQLLNQIARKSKIRKG